MSGIATVCVIGAGVMGAGIAAQAANAGVNVVLLDVMPDAAKDAIGKMKKAQPAAFMHPTVAKRITPGCTAGDLALVKDCDWIIEAIIERPDIKQDLYRSLLPHLKADAIVSSNTSTLPLRVLTEGMDDGLKKRFLITHFFNPPRYMRLFEIVAGPDTDPDMESRIRDFADTQMGKSVVTAKDTPGFIANRIGTFWLHAAVTGAFRQGIGVEEADAVLGRPAGVPRTGIFGLLDLVGLDLMPHILTSFETALAVDDPFHALGNAPDLLERMIEDGYTGRKGKGGFYRLNTEGGDKIKEVINLQTGGYAPAQRPKPAAATAARKGGLRATLEHDSAEGRYARSVLVPTLAYAASLVPEIADDPESVDRAMRLGYNWKTGPFELIDQLGPAWLAAAITEQGLIVPSLLKAVGDGSFYRVRDGRLQQFTGTDYENVRRPDGVLLLEDIKRAGPPIARNMSASLWNIGDGVACLEFTSKMNSLNPFILWMIDKAVKELPGRGFKALVIHNDASNFSVGANIGMLLYGAKLRLWPFVRWVLKRGQETFSRLKYAPFPVVGAPSGMALGGGCEVLLHCDAIEAHAETYIGLVEAGVGIVPGWGGCKELLGRWSIHKDRPGGPMPPVMKAFEPIAMAQVAKSAMEARDFLFLRPDDTVVMNHDRVLAAAKARALKLAEDYAPPEPYELHLPGPTGRTALDLAVRDFVNKGVASPHDGVIAHELAGVLSGGDTDALDPVYEDQLLRLERDANLKLARMPKTLARVEHMLKKGKPLRN
ncbi:MAG: 3-hydroxyacyl-CoA dehydrogenase NAD-binding domain-containing protein [Proteobacteria bacterium]|nr:3-hydroxyacyl-CoA dehydrogenase NAD-binding domain-containing protein [Pseudomonadota bacterium]MDA1024064.1 3-hydroxyacyl-CoA dehydrogenase NAD-binding domain-containing protein [Pseudomonadota bacterium]